MKPGRKPGDGRGRLGGRKKGTQNKLTLEAKEVIGSVVDFNAQYVQEKLDRVLDPEKWLYYYMKLAEFRVPKLQSVSLSGEIKTSDLKSDLEKLAEKEI